MLRDVDAAIRSAAFAWLDEQKLRHGDVLPFDILRGGFEFEGRRVPLLGPQGIFKPAILPEMPLSIMTVAPKLGREAPYTDEVQEGLLLYRYRGTDPQHHDNVALRRAYERGAPLVYLYGVSAGEYEAVYPVRVVGDDSGVLTFLVDLTPADVSGLPHPVLTVHGTKDRNAPFGAGQEWAEALPNARLLAVEGAAHQAWVRRPDVLEAIREFLASH